MLQQVPTSSIKLMSDVYIKIFPEVRKELAFWTRHAQQIPNSELRSQALASISTKRFHCQGGGVYALLAGDHWREAIRFIVAYQTISDYLDNLCDRSTSLDPEDFRLLHQSMLDALDPDYYVKNYYALRDDQNDGDYLNDLVRTCQKALKVIPKFETIQPFIRKLCSLYGDLQVHKHVDKNERVPRLTNWFATYKEEFPQLKWHEFSAAAGSTLGIFCLVSYALDDKISTKLASEIYRGYFPYMQGLHILLDYYIDQKEDETEADLNFCTYYDNQSELVERLQFFVKHARNNVRLLPNHPFHEMVVNGLVGLYLGDWKVNELKGAERIKRSLLGISGTKAKFFHWNTKVYYKFTKNDRKQK